MSCSCQRKKNPVVVSINKKKLLEGDINEIALYSFTQNPIEFETRLNDLGLKFDDDKYFDDLKFLSELHRQGGDVGGLLRDSNDKPIRFDFRDFVLGIPVDNSSNLQIELV